MSAPFDLLTDALPALRALHDPAALWPLLERLLLAHAPSGGANLPGAIADEIGALAGSLGLGERFLPQIGATGNAALALGADKAQADVVVAAHMDRPSFRVRSVEHGALYPICADRFPAGEYRVAAKALRFEDGRLTVGARGEIVSIKGGDQPALRFEADQGALAWQDTVVMDPPPTFRDGTVTGTGLDNSLGVLTALLAAAALASLEDALRQQDRRCLIVFTDQEEGPPEGFFGHGAARLAYTLPPPTYGAVIVDAHTAGPGLEPQPGAGASHSTASNWGRGSIVPPHYHALALDLAAGVNKARPGTVQMNNGYLSRSDDMILGRWARILALTGPPMTDPHTGHESARLSDVQAGAWWLACFLAAALGLVPTLRERYTLGR